MTAPERVRSGDKNSKKARNAVVGGGLALLLAVVTGCSTADAAATVTITANKDFASKFFTPDAIKDLAFTVTGEKIAEAKLTYDGQPVTGTTEGPALVYRPTNLAEGAHTFTADNVTKTFEVDATAPVLTVDKVENVDKEKPYTLTGSVQGAKTVKVDDKDVSLDNGRFSVNYDKAPLSVKVWAQDEAGNVSEQTVTIGQNYPAMRAVHMTGIAWLTPSLKDPVIQALKDKRIDAVQLDIKDEDGAVAFDAASEAANLSGADKKNANYNPAEAVKEIHDLGGTVIGRVVAFKDPLLATWAAKNGRMDWVIQDKSGNPYRAGTYGAGAFTNFANAEVRKYNIELGVEAAKAGFDSIMFDYIRRPEANATSGNLAGQVFPGIGSTDPQDSIANFLAEAQPQIHAAGAQVGAAVFGISAFTPISVAQNIPKMAKYLDYINPMVYPSHWGPGEYSVAAPNSMPYEIVKPLDDGLQPPGARHQVRHHPVAAGLPVGGRELRRGEHPQADQGGRGRGHQQLHPLERQREVHVVGPGPEGQVLGLPGRDGVLDQQARQPLRGHQGRRGGRGLHQGLYRVERRRAPGHVRGSGRGTGRWHDHPGHPGCHCPAEHSGSEHHSVGIVSAQP